MSNPTMTGHRTATAAVLLIAGGALAVATWLGGEHGLAVGLVIYWCWSNVLTILQQYIIMRRYKVENPIDKLIARLRGQPVEAT